MQNTYLISKKNNEKDRIEALRSNMHNIINIDNIHGEQALRASQALDVAIVEYMKTINL